MNSVPYFCFFFLVPWKKKLVTMKPRTAKVEYIGCDNNDDQDTPPPTTTTTSTTTTTATKTEGVGNNMLAGGNDTCAYFAACNHSRVACSDVASMSSLNLDGPTENKFGIY